MQTSAYSNHPYSCLNSFVPMNAHGRIYSALRDSVPIIDAAILKIVRLCGGFRFETGSEALNEHINNFFESIDVGGNQTGIQAFAASYLADLLTYGSAVGEMVASDSEFYALYIGELDALEVKRGKNNLSVEFYNGNEKIQNQDLILFSALNPKSGNILGTSLLCGLPFISDILLKIYNTIGENWEHAGNVRYAVTYKPQSDGSDSGFAKERANQIAAAWRDAMSSKDAVKDFVAVGDISVEVIGADSKVLDSEIPVRQLLEQIIAKTGLPPYMLGLSWSSTERMSSEQADALTTELEAYRRILEPVLVKIARKYMEINSIYAPVSVQWDDITLKDETELAKARLYDAQTQKILTEAEN
ncbi:MAG: serine/threonine protein phosphatase [Clostridiales bacterium]|nr:serine/threonine protein phosphatase [Clostridiales bacterium]